MMFKEVAELEKTAIADLRLIKENPTDLEIKSFVVSYLKSSLAVALRENKLMKDVVINVSDRTNRMKKHILRRKSAFTVEEWMEVVECLALNVNDHV